MGYLLLSMLENLCSFHCKRLVKHWLKSAIQKGPSLHTVAVKPRGTGEVSHNFAPGDTVEVCEGELIHLQGKVIRVDGNKITMIPKHEDLKVGVEVKMTFFLNL